jgi:hypothetical protein
VRYDCVWDDKAPVPKHGYGVRDGHSREWLVQRLAAEAAGWQAAVLNLHYDQDGERPDTNAWYRDPPVFVERRLTPSRKEIALLHVWVREPDGIYGHVSLLERASRTGGCWVPATALRPYCRTKSPPSMPIRPLRRRGARHSRPIGRNQLAAVDRYTVGARSRARLLIRSGESPCGPSPGP